MKIKSFDFNSSSICLLQPFQRTCQVFNYYGIWFFKLKMSLGDFQFLDIEPTDNSIMKRDF